MGLKSGWHQRQHVITTTAPVAAACLSNHLYKRTTAESLTLSYHVSSGLPSSQVKLDLEVAGKPVHEKHWKSGIVKASSTKLTALAVFCAATLEATGGTLGPRLRVIRSPVHLWDARARDQRDETPWTLKVVHLMGLECLGACRSNVEFCRFFLPGLGSQCQIWLKTVNYILGDWRAFQAAQDWTVLIL